MENPIKNTKFDNLVNYETSFSSNSSRNSIVFQSSADPSSLSALIKNSQLVQYTFVLTQEKIVQQKEGEVINL